MENGKKHMHVHTIQMKMFALQPRRWKCSLFFADGGGSKKGQNIDIGHVVNNEKCWVAVCKASAATQKKLATRTKLRGDRRSIIFRYQMSMFLNGG